MWNDLIHVRIPGKLAFCGGRPSEHNLLDESSVTITGESLRQPSSTRRLEITAYNVDGIECEVIRLLFEQQIDVRRADTIQDGEYIFLLFTVTAARFTEEAWQSLRGKLLRMVRLSRFRGAGSLSETAQMYKVAVEVPVHAHGSLRLLWEALHDRGLQVVQSAMHISGDSLIERHPMMSFAASCCICNARLDSSSGAAAEHRCHVLFSVCDLLHLLPDCTPEQELEKLLTEQCAAACLEPCQVSVLCDSHRQVPSQLPGDTCALPTPHLCWQRPPVETWGASKCPLSHFSCSGDGRRHFVSHALPSAVTQGTDICVDDSMGGSTCTCIEIQCVDRKGLMLDILWAVHSLGISLVQCSVNSAGLPPASGAQKRICVQIFLRDGLGPLTDEARLRFVLEQLHRAITLPVSVVPGALNSLEVLVLGLLGPGSRGRPCVTKDVTEVIQQESLKIQAAFVGILDDQAVQENLPGEALHDMVDNLMFPLLQRNNAVTALPSWDDVDGDDALLMHTARDTCSSCSPRAQSSGEGSGLRYTTTALQPLQNPNGLQPCSCEASSAGTSPLHRDIPILHALEQHAYCPFLEDDAPLTCTRTPNSLTFVPKVSLPQGLLASGLQEATAAVRGQGNAQKQRVPVDSMLSFFGEESIPHSHSPTGCRHLVELHHFVCQHTGDDTEAAAGRLKRLLEQHLCTVSCQESNVSP